jgi:hypothetical protein
MRRPARRVLLHLACLTVPLWLGPLGWWLAYHPWAALGYCGLVLLSAELVFVLFSLIAVAVLVGGPLVAVVRSLRLRALLAAGQALVFLLSFFGGLLLGRVVWRDRVERVVARGEPLVAAIHEVTARNGRPPETLDELVPEYLAAVPTTGIGTAPQFKYACDEPDRYKGNPWVLIVYPPCHPMGFDNLMYFPLQNYPGSGYGGWIERIDGWGYVHE